MALLFEWPSCTCYQGRQLLNNGQVDVCRIGKKLKDPVRNKEVASTPEEKVRQAVILYLHGSLNIPKGLMSVEKSILQQGKQKRADLVIYDRKGAPWMVVECKAPSVSINQSVLEQVSNYNRIFGAPYLLVTNGTDHFCVDIREDEMIFLENLPVWK